MLMTTAYSPSEEDIAQARRLAGELGADYIPRDRQSIQKLLQRDGGILVWAGGTIKYYVKESSQPFYYHPGTAVIRIKRLLNGEPDVLLRHCGMQQGDSVLDCTAGMASDAVVFAFAAGERGRITALESRRLVHCIVAEGLRSYQSGLPGLDEAMRRIELLHADYGRYLEQQPDNSYDIVYFDPMFGRPVERSSAIQPLRQLADYSPLTREPVEEAKRVAARRVVVKADRENGGTLAELGFQIQMRGSSTVYGVIEIE